MESHVEARGGGGGCGKSRPAKQAVIRQSLAGTVVEAITLRAGNEKVAEALIDNYLRVRVRGQLEPIRCIGVEVANDEDGVLVGPALAERFVSTPLSEPERKPD